MNQLERRAVALQELDFPSPCLSHISCAGIRAIADNVVH
jgi:hypothetical protein